MKPAPLGAQRARDAEHLGAALALARHGRTAPNPRVGARVVSDGVVIGEGFHARAGAAHAEVVALSAAGERARGATLYCTLEPCNHHGRTPPCTEAILAAGITRVVLGARDPARHGPVAGVERLRAAGIEVETGVLERECEDEIEDFACLVLRKRPLVTLKAAVTLDGRIATRTGDSKWITGEAARREAHAMRERACAVLVGVGTVLADDPRLTTHMLAGAVDPIRIVLDTTLRTPPDAALVAHASASPTWIVHGPAAPRERRAALARPGVELIEVPLAGARLELAAVLFELGRRDVMHVLVEGGAAVHGALLDAGLADRAAIFVAPLVLGDPEARPLAEQARPAHTMASARRLRDVRSAALGDDVLVEGRFVPHPARATEG